jgi:ADP-ribose pyrophosphatase YjhB (NUDIX family)
MSREFPTNPVVGVGAVIAQDGRVLLIRRGQAPLLGEWSLPGGVVECGETLREGIVREVREETGLGVETGKLLGVYERVVRSDDGRVRYHYVLIDFLCGVISEELKAGSDAADVRWFTRAELGSLGLPLDTQEVIGKGLDFKPDANTSEELSS